MANDALLPPWFCLPNSTGTTNRNLTTRNAPSTRVMMQQNHWEKKALSFPSPVVCEERRPPERHEVQVRVIKPRIPHAQDQVERTTH